MLDLRNLRAEEVANQHIVEVALRREETIVEVPRIVVAEVPHIVAVRQAQVREVATAEARHTQVVAVHALRTRAEVILVADNFNA